MTRTHLSLPTTAGHPALFLAASCLYHQCSELQEVSDTAAELKKRLCADPSHIPMDAPHPPLHCSATQPGGAGGGRGVALTSLLRPTSRLGTAAGLGSLVP